MQKKLDCLKIYEAYIQAILINKDREEVMESKGFRMEISLKVSGKTTKLMAKENIGMLMGITMRGIG